MPLPSRPVDPDDIETFYLHCNQITVEARFVIEAIPNAEPAAAHRLLMQLRAILAALQALDDPWTNPANLADAVELATEQARALSDFLQNFRGRTFSADVPRIYSGGRGRPRFDIDLDAAKELHDMGNSWAQVAQALGVGRRTLLDHMERAGMSTARPAYDFLTDNELDELVAEISLLHPFVGGSIVLGHLESLGLHIQRERVTASLQRVDAIGVLTR